MKVSLLFLGSQIVLSRKYVLSADIGYVYMRVKQHLLESDERL